MSAAPVAEPQPAGWGAASGPGLLLGVALLTLAFQLPIFDRWFSFMDEGHILLYAEMLANGGELYRDATVYPLPGAFYLLALVFSIFEPSNLVARWVVVVEFTAFACLCTALLRRALPLHYVLAGFVLLLAYRIWAFPHWHMYSYSTTALLILLGALLVLLRGLRNGSPRGVAAAGLLFGLGVLAKQDYGAAALLALTSLMILHATTTAREERPSLPRLLLAFFAPAATVGAATGLYFWHQGVLGDLLQFTVFNHFVGMSHYPYSTFPPFLPLFEQDALLRGRGASAFIPGILLTADWRTFASSALYMETPIVDTALKFYYHIPTFFTLVAAVRLWWCRAELRAPVRRERYLVEFSLWALAVSFLLLLFFNRPQDYVHLAVLYFPFLFLALIHVHALLRTRRTLAWVLALLFLPPAGLAASYTGFLWWRIRSDHTAPIDSVRAGIYVTEDQAGLFNELLAYLRENSEPDEPVAVVPYFPLLSFYAERRGPHRSSYIVWPFPEFPDRDRRIIDAMESTGTNLVIYNFTQFTVFNLVAEYAPELYDYLVEEWEIDRMFTTKSWGYKLAGLRRRKEPHPKLLSAETPLEVSVAGEWTPPRPVEPAERSDYARVTPWPFRPTLEMKPTRDGRTVVSLPLTVPAGARLRTAVAVHPKRWYLGDPPWSEFELTVVDGNQRQILFQRRLVPNSRKEDRGWIEVDVPLDAWSGRSVMLELSSRTNKRSGEDLLQAGWALPVIESGPAVEGGPVGAGAG